MSLPHRGPILSSPPARGSLHGGHFLGDVHHARHTEASSGAGDYHSGMYHSEQTSPGLSMRGSVGPSPLIASSRVSRQPSPSRSPHRSPRKARPSSAHSARKKAPSSVSSRSSGAGGGRVRSASPAKHRASTGATSAHKHLHYTDLKTGAHKNPMAAGSVERLRNTISDLEHKLERAKHHASDWKKEASELEKRNHYLAADLAHYVKLNEEAQSHLKDASQAQRSLALRDDEAAKLREHIEGITSQLTAEKSKVDKVNSAVAMMEKDLKEVIDDKDERLRELEEASHESDTRNRQLEEMLAAERDKSMKLQSKVNELEETGLQLSSAREEAARGERDAALMDKEALGVRLTASEARVKELESEAASRAVQDKAMEQRLYTLEATVTLQQKEVEQARLREGEAVGRLEDVEERLRGAEAESSEFESRGEELKEWGETMLSENKKMQTRLEAQNLQIQEIGVVAARHSQASHEAGEKAEQLSRRLEELSNAHEDAIKRLERAEEELVSARARQEDAEKKLRSSERSLSDVREAFDETKARLDAVEGKRKAQGEMLEQQTEMMRGLTDRLTKAEGDAERLKAENAELATDRDQVRARLRELAERSEASSRQCQQLQKEVVVYKGRCGINAMLNAKLVGLMSQVVSGDESGIIDSAGDGMGTGGADWGVGGFGVDDGGFDGEVDAALLSALRKGGGGTASTGVGSMLGVGGGRGGGASGGGGLGREGGGGGDAALQAMAKQLQMLASQSRV